MLYQAFNAVADFHRRKNIDYRQRLAETTPRVECPQTLFLMRQESESQLRRFLAQSEERRDYRHIRTHLVLEEVAECLAAMWAGDEVGTLDGLCDAIYVLVGSAVTMELPLAEAFEDVHRANMARASSASSDNPRLKEKGADWVPPRIKEIIEAHRAKQPISASPLAIDMTVTHAPHEEKTDASADRGT